MLAELDAAIDAHFRAYLERDGWREVRVDESSRGAVREFENGRMTLRFGNDRHLLEVDVGAIAEPTSLRSIASVKDLLSPAENGRWNVSYAQSAAFIAQHIGVLEAAFALSAWRRTVDKINALRV